MTEFDRALPYILVYEGGYSNHPADPGGATMKGVTQKTYDFWRKAHGLAPQNVRAITNAELGAIYKKNYWDACRCDDLPSGVNLAVFDFAVNSGPNRAGKILQQALGADYVGAIDGRVGDGTVGAVRKAKDHDRLIAGICERRLAFMRQLSTWKSFGRGWSARVANVLKVGQAWATGSVGPMPVAVSAANGNAKADVSSLPTATIGVSKATVLTTIGTVGTTATAVSNSLDPVKDTLGSYVPWIGVAFAVLAAVGIVCTVLANQLKNTNASARDGALEDFGSIKGDEDALFEHVPVEEVHTT